MTEKKTIRKAPENCIRETDMDALGKTPKLFGVIEVFGEPMEITLHKFTDLNGRDWLADHVTGTLYDPKTGRCNTLQLRLVEVLGVAQ